MDYRVIERYYGPDIRFNDWKADGGELVSAGGALHIASRGIADVTRSDLSLWGWRRRGGCADVQH